MQIEHKEIKKIDGTGKRVGVVVSRFNKEITDKILEHAEQELKDANVEDYDIVSVAGGVEVPIALNRLAKRNKYDALVALSCVIQGETPHFDMVANMIQQGTLRVGLDHNLPIGFGVLTLNKPEQAESRYSIGAEAVRAALETSKIK